jgi:ribosomal protein S18 acetylase RimI-like enzyme
VYRQRGDLKNAERHHRKALRLHQEIGDLLGQAGQLASLGLLDEERGRGQPRELLEQARALYEQAGAGGAGPAIVREALERLRAA